eukprot:6396341-Pyramimonas_sp.AAC.1
MRQYVGNTRGDLLKAINGFQESLGGLGNTVQSGLNQHGTQLERKLGAVERKQSKLEEHCI